jgi:hypothetical protein
LEPRFLKKTLPGVRILWFGLLCQCAITYEIRANNGIGIGQLMGGRIVVLCILTRKIDDELKKF